MMDCPNTRQSIPNGTVWVDKPSPFVVFEIANREQKHLTKKLSSFMTTVALSTIV